MNLIKLNRAELEINTIIRVIIIGIGLILLMIIINTIFTQDIESGFDRFFDLI